MEHFHALVACALVSFAGACGGAGGSGAKAGESEKHPLVGAPAPDFALKAQHGKKRVSLEDTRGKVTIVDKQELDRLNIALSLQYTDDNSKLLQGILIEVEEAYAHCPRALKFSNLWDVDTIASHQDTRPISDRPYDS